MPSARPTETKPASRTDTAKQQRPNMVINSLLENTRSASLHPGRASGPFTSVLLDAQTSATGNVDLDLPCPPLGAPALQPVVALGERRPAVGDAIDRFAVHLEQNVAGFQPYPGRLRVGLDNSDLHT